MHFPCAYVRSCACVCMWVWVRLRVLVYVCVCMWWLPPIFLQLLLSPPLFLPLPLPPTPSPPCVCVCVYVCVLFFPSLFPPALKAALHHPPPLHSPSCFDLCYQDISCVRLMGFSPGTPVFPFIPWDVWNWILALPFPRSDFIQGVLLIIFFLHHL